METLTADEAAALRHGSAPYGGSHLCYDFMAELTKARERERIRERTNGRLEREAVGLFWLSEFPTAPTPEAFHRHAERFGKGGVQEIADLYGVDLAAGTEVRRFRRRTSAHSVRQTSRARQALEA
jgi:hypothetical protein